MAEMFGKATDVPAGAVPDAPLDAECRFYGGNAIVGGHPPLAVGLALADKMAGRREVVTACFFGEGSDGRGRVPREHQPGGAGDLPVLFCCENNRYAKAGNSLVSSESQTDLALKASAYGLTAWAVDGMDPDVVAAATDNASRRSGAAVARCSSSSRPTGSGRTRCFDPDLLTGRPTRSRSGSGHAIRSRACHEARGRGSGRRSGCRGDGDEARAEVEAAVAEADEAPLEPIEQLLAHVTAGGDVMTETLTYREAMRLAIRRP
ncbi:MAG: thiamine pyrophosphate-dependent enzyme [Acidimicrobiales bacterium]